MGYIITGSYLQENHSKGAYDAEKAFRSKKQPSKTSH